MTTTITARFYRISGEEGVALEAILASLATKSRRERQINTADNDEATPFVIRLEDFDDASPPVVSGQFARIADRNHPPEATDDGLKRLTLADGSGLGYPAAFAYHPELKTIALEHSRDTLGIARVLMYLNMAAGLGKLVGKPVANEPAWDRYKKGKPRKLTLTLATPQFDAVEGEVNGVLSATSKLNEIFDAPVITIEVSMGHRKGSLNEGMVTKVLNYFTEGVGKKADVRSLRATVKPDDGSQSDSLDFLNELLVSKGSLELDGDPTGDYAVRKAFVLSELRKHTPYIRRMYGVGA